MLGQKIIMVDLDGVVADYEKARKYTTWEQRNEKGFFENLDPLPGAIEAVNTLAKHHDVWFLSTAPWTNVYSWTEKRIWVEKHLGELAFKKLMLSHDKSKVIGNYLIDDNLHNGASGFTGYHIHFGSVKFPDWDTVLKFLIKE
jgi:5'-nucleotidase